MKSISLKAVWNCLGILVAASLVNAATLTVTVPDNSGPGRASGKRSLRTGPGDTITFDGSIHGNPIVLTNGELVITNSLTITGLDDQLLISANASSQILHLPGASPWPSAACPSQQAAPGDNGGAILNEASSSLTLTDALSLATPHSPVARSIMPALDPQQLNADE